MTEQAEQLGFGLNELVDRRETVAVVAEDHFDNSGQGRFWTRAFLFSMFNSIAVRHEMTKEASLIEPIDPRLVPYCEMPAVIDAYRQEAIRWGDDFRVFGSREDVHKLAWIRAGLRSASE